MQLSKFVKFREESFGGVLFETRSEKVFTLNQAAAAIVGELASGGAVSDTAMLAARLKDRFQDPDNRLESDVQALIGTLQQKGLIDGQPG